MIMKKRYLSSNFRKHLTTVDKSTLIKATVIGVHFWSITKCWPFDLDLDTESAIHEVQSYFDRPKLPAFLRPNYLHDDSTDLPQLFSKATRLDGEKDLQFLRAFWTFSRATGVMLDVKTANGAVTSTGGTPGDSASWVNITRPFDIFFNLDLSLLTDSLPISIDADGSDFKSSISNFLSDFKEVMTAVYDGKKNGYYQIYSNRYDACKKNKLPFVFPLIIFTPGHSSCALMLPNGKLWALGTSDYCYAEEFKPKKSGKLSQPNFDKMTVSVDTAGSAVYAESFSFVGNRDILDMPQKAPNCMHKTFFDLFRLFAHHHNQNGLYDAFVACVIQKSYERLLETSGRASLKVDIPRVVTRAALSSFDIYNALAGIMKSSNLSRLKGIVESEIVRHLRLNELEEIRNNTKASLKSVIPDNSHLRVPKYLLENISLVALKSLTEVEKILYMFVSLSLGFKQPIERSDLRRLLQNSSVSEWESEYVYEKRSRFNLFELAGLFKIHLSSEEISALFNAVYLNNADLLAHFPEFIPLGVNSFVLKALTALKNPFDTHATTECLRTLAAATDEVFAKFGDCLLPGDLINYESYKQFRVIFEHRNQNFGDFGVVYDLASLVWRRLALPHLLLSKYRQIQAETPSQLRLPLLAESNKVLISPDEVVPMAPANYADLYSICSKLSFILATDADSMNAKLWADLGTHTQIMESFDAKNPENMMIPDGADAIGTSFADLYAYLGEYSTD